MITIDRGATNSVIFTLTEKSQLIDPNYLFSFVNDNSEEIKIFNLQDLSNYPRRYNLFELGENTVEDLPNGVVSLQYGWGTYSVYEGLTQSLLIPLTTGRVLEVGRYFVNGYPVEDSSDIDGIYL